MVKYNYRKRGDTMKEFLNTIPNLSQFARESGISRNTLKVIKSGKQEPLQKTLIKFAEHLKSLNYTDTEILNIILSK
jgi:transcriptional regulator with XRE-family HTH domain